MRQMDDRYHAYVPDSPLNRDDIIISKSVGYNQSRIEVYRNNNNNGMGSLFDAVDLPFTLSDFEVTDFNEDGYNDIIVSGDVLGNDANWLNNLAYIYCNVQGQFLNHNPVVEFNAVNGGYDIGNLTKIAIADFNKDGWNDLIFVAEALYNSPQLGQTSIFINQRTSPLFNTSLYGYAQRFFMPNPWDYPVRAKTLDIYNTGGIAFLGSYNSPVIPPGTYGINVVNALNEDPPPPPPIVQGFLEYDHDNIWHPHIHMNNRGERDFNHYEIWKWKLNDPIWGNEEHRVDPPNFNDTGWTDLSECVDVSGQDSPWWNCYYYAKEVDYGNRLSIPSQLALYSVGCVPVCNGCGDNPNHNLVQYYNKPQLNKKSPVCIALKIK